MVSAKNGGVQITNSPHCQQTILNWPTLPPPFVIHNLVKKTEQVKNYLVKIQKGFVGLQLKGDCIKNILVRLEIWLSLEEHKNALHQVLQDI